MGPRLGAKKNPRNLGTFGADRGALFDLGRRTGLGWGLE